MVKKCSQSRIQRRLARKLVKKIGYKPDIISDEERQKIEDQKLLNLN